MASVPGDMSNLFNTKLSPQEEKAYQQWAKASGRAADVYDYDMKGAWKAGAGQADNGHFPDTFKKPNHPTFSNESIYSGSSGFEGGTWSKENGRDVFIPGPGNAAFRSPDMLLQYFKEVEPEAILRYPAMKRK